MKNRYIIRSRISEKKFREILKYFCMDLEAVKVAKLSNISKKTIDKIFKQLRILMLHECVLVKWAKRKTIAKFQGEIEIDESYFGGKRGRGAGNKTPVFILTELHGMLKRDSKIYT